MDSRITKKQLDDLGFVQVEGAPKGVLSNGILQLHPRITDSLDDLMWDIIRGDWNLILPYELVPVTDKQLVTLLNLMKDIKETK